MQFEVRALRGSEGLAVLTLDAADVAEARAAAEGQGYTVLSARPKRLVAGLPALFAPRFPLLLFSQELVSLLSAGLSLPEVVDTMVEKEGRPEVRRVFEQIRASILEGRSFSSALERFPAYFPPLHIATVRASERTGDLAEALGRFISYQTRVDQVKRKLVSASIYPIVLLAVGGLVTLFLLGYVVPRFAGIYEDVGRDLPWLSTLLLRWGRFINEHGMAVTGAVGGVAVLGLVFAARARDAILAGLWRIPAARERLLVYQLARFYRTVGMLLRGGTPLVVALDMVQGLLQPDLREGLDRAVRLIREGRSLSSAMESCGLTTPVALRMLRVGAKSGDMAGMMERIAVFYDDELARWVEWFTRLFEPLLMAVIGVVIGAIVVLMYLPIFELAGSLQ